MNNPTALQTHQELPQGYNRPDTPDEINLLEYVYAIVKAKWWIIGLTVFGLITGFIIALIKGPSYVAEAVIAPKESQSSSKAPNLSGLGMFTGFVANQLNIGGNPGLDKIDVILDTKKFFAEMAETYCLYPFLFPEKWDYKQNTWIPTALPHEPLNTGGYIKNSYIEKLINKNSTMTIKIKTPDSLLTDTMMSVCLVFLDSYIKSGVQKEAVENKAYLEQQLIGITDPLLRGKIQELIANELEKMMVVSKEAFSVIDPPFFRKIFKEKKIYPVVCGAALFFLGILWSIFSYAISTADKTEKDKELIGKISKELRLKL